MIMVLDLLRNIFIIMFFILMALEIVVLVSMIILYKNPLVGNNAQIEKASRDNTYEILNSFNFLFIRKYYQIETDLLLISKHLYSMYLTLNDIDEAYPTFQKTSLFVKSYKQCFVYKDFSSNPTFVKNISKYNTTADPKTKYDLIYEIFSNEQYVKFNELNEETIVKAFMSSKAANYLSVISKDFNINPDDFKGFDYETYLCYAISILKSMFIRDTIFERIEHLVDRYTIYFNNYIFEYPIDFQSMPRLLQTRYYNQTDPNCANSYIGQDCFTTFKNRNYNEYNNKIFFEYPILSHNGYGNYLKY